MKGAYNLGRFLLVERTPESQQFEYLSVLELLTQNLLLNGKWMEKENLYCRYASQCSPIFDSNLLLGHLVLMYVSGHM